MHAEYHVTAFAPMNPSQNSQARIRSTSGTEVEEVCSLPTNTGRTDGRWMTTDDQREVLAARQHTISHPLDDPTRARFACTRGTYTTCAPSRRTPPLRHPCVLFLFLFIFSASYALFDSLMAYVSIPVHSGYSLARHITLDIARTPTHYYIHLLPLLLEYPLLELFALSSHGAF